MDLTGFVRDVPDFPKAGIVFKDLTPLLLDASALERAVAEIGRYGSDRGADLVLAAEARGFVLGGAVAARIGAGFVPARKPGRLPWATASASYALEYGVDALEVHADALASGRRVLVHDDLVATGGTAAAMCELAEQAGAEVVGCAFVVELPALGGRERLAGHDVFSLMEL